MNSTNNIIKSVIKTDSQCISLKKYLKTTYNLSYLSFQTLLRKNQVKIISTDKINSLKHDLLTYNLKLGDEVVVYNFNVDKPESEEAQSNEVLNRKKVFFTENQQNLKRLYEKMLVFEAKDFIILNKPSGLSCQSGSKLLFALDELLEKCFPENSSPKLIHRIDRRVNGLMIVGKTDEYVSRIGKSMKEKKGEVEKIYFLMTQEYPIVFSLVMNKINNTKSLKSKNKFKSLLVSIFNQPSRIFSDEDYSKFVILVNEEYIFTSESFEFTCIKSKFGKLGIEEVYKRLADKYSVIGEFIVDSIVFNGKRVIDKENISDVIKGSDFYNIFNKDTKGERTLDNYSVLRYKLTTGRKHQIRKHCSICLLSPILLDEMYLYDKSRSVMLEELRTSMKKEGSLGTKPGESSEFKAFLDKYHISSNDYMIFLSSMSFSLYDNELYDDKSNKSTKTNEKVSISNEKLPINTDFKYKTTFQLTKLPFLIETFLESLSLKKKILVKESFINKKI